MLSISESEFNENKPMWSVTMGDESKIELVTGGELKEVEYSERYDYIS